MGRGVRGNQGPWISPHLHMPSDWLAQKANASAISNLVGGERIKEQKETVKGWGYTII